jgi:hypothetical protein
VYWLCTRTCTICCKQGRITPKRRVGKYGLLDKKRTTLRDLSLLRFCRRGPGSPCIVAACWFLYVSPLLWLRLQYVITHILLFIALKLLVLCMYVYSRGGPKTAPAPRPSWCYVSLILFTYLSLLVIRFLHQRIGVVFSYSRCLCVCSVFTSVLYCIVEVWGGKCMYCYLVFILCNPRIWDCVYRYSCHSYANYLYRFRKYDTLLMYSSLLLWFP